MLRLLVGRKSLSEIAISNQILFGLGLDLEKDGFTGLVR